VSKYEEEDIDPNSFIVAENEELENQTPPPPVIDVREEELQTDFTDPRDLSVVERFKEQILQIFDIDANVVENLQTRTDEIEVSKYATRRERMGYSWIPTAEDRKRRVPLWAREAQCPLCGAIMTPLKSKRDTKFGENITYQCHRVNEIREPCLTVVSITTGVYYLMQPGDFTSSDWNWREVSSETLAVIPGVKVSDVSPTEEFVRPETKPLNPWTKGKTQSKVIWNCFWDTILEDGECGVQELRDKVIAQRSQDKAGKFRSKLERDIDGLPSWMHRRTGYVVKQYGNVFRVVGKSKGDITSFPYSEKAYREEHGMTGLGF
jgi:hypothetical protein